jgi:hypothetical protein
MNPTATQRHQALQAALYATTPRARLIHCRPSGSLIVITLAMPDGSVKLIRATTCDHPELDALPENERSRVRSAFLALQKQEAPPDAAA